MTQAQSPPSESLDKDVPTPAVVGTLGQQDAGALSELVAHLKVVGAGPWAGMQGTGQITYGEDTTTYSATLSVLGGTHFRLDGQTQAGQLSIRINGNNGKIQEADGHQYPILPSTASSGIFQFELPRLADFPHASTSFLDRGSVSISGTLLHRLTYEIPAASADNAPMIKGAVVTDFYFDPISHLLIKSANSIRINGAGNNEFLRVITYGDYRKVGDLMIPFRYTQTLNGQKQWTLQLSDVQLNPDLNTTLFEF
jgi:hypothetical protein